MQSCTDLAFFECPLIITVHYRKHQMVHVAMLNMLIFTQHFKDLLRSCQNDCKKLSSVHLTPALNKNIGCSVILLHFFSFLI